MKKIFVIMALLLSLCASAQSVYVSPTVTYMDDEGAITDSLYMTVIIEKKKLIIEDNYSVEEFQFKSSEQDLTIYSNEIAVVYVLKNYKNTLYIREIPIAGTSRVFIATKVK
jgi:hypothetical protein